MIPFLSWTGIDKFRHRYYCVGHVDYRFVDTVYGMAPGYFCLPHHSNHQAQMKGGLYGIR